MFVHQLISLKNIINSSYSLWELGNAFNECHINFNHEKSLYESLLLFSFYDIMQFDIIKINLTYYI